MRRLSQVAGRAAAPLRFSAEAAYDWRARRRMVGPLPLVDVVLGGAFTLVALTSISFIERFGPYPVYVANFVLCLGIAVTQFVRLSFPRASFVAAYGLLAGYALLYFLSPVNLGIDPIILVAATSLHAVTRWVPSRRWGTAGVLLALLGAVANPMTLTAHRDTPVDLGPGLPYSVACAVTVGGVYLRAASRRREAEDHARDVAAAAERAISDERLHLARELHDLVGHSLTTVKVQANTALALGADGQTESLRAIRDTAGSALDSVRQLVAFLRADATAPTAHLGQVVDLIKATLASGTPVSATLPHDLAALDETWSALQRLTLLRLVGEALTNAVRHGTGQVTLHLAVADGQCRLSVTNPAPAARPGEGNGLIGLAERLRLVGGTLSHGPEPLPGGEPGFALRASFPVDSGEAA